MTAIKTNKITTLLSCPHRWLNCWLNCVYLADVFGAWREIRKPSNDGQDEEGSRQSDGDQDDDDRQVPTGVLLTEVADLGVEVLLNFILTYSDLWVI